MPADVVGALMFLEDYIRYTKLPRKVRRNSMSSICSTELFRGAKSWFMLWLRTSSLITHIYSETWHHL